MRSSSRRRVKSGSRSGSNPAILGPRRWNSWWPIPVSGFVPRNRTPSSLHSNRRTTPPRGQTVLVAKNGCEALEILARERVDVILMDIQMPEMDGFQATAAIREKEKTSGGRLPIVALTANAMRGDGERCLAQGMDAYLAKPFRIADLDRVLSEVAGAAAH